MSCHFAFIAADVVCGFYNGESFTSAHSAVVVNVQLDESERCIFWLQDAIMIGVEKIMNDLIRSRHAVSTSHMARDFNLQAVSDLFVFSGFPDEFFPLSIRLGC